MASSYDHYLNCSTRRGYSKSQMCLFKILHIISSIPPSKEEPFPNNKGLGIDLNLRFCSFEPKIGQSEEASATASDASAIDQGNNNNEGGGKEEEEGVREKSVDTQVQSFEVDNNGVDHVESESEEDGDGNRGCDGGGGETASFQGRGHDSNCLDLLIEAARVLSGKDESDSEEVRELDGELRTQGASQGDLEEEEAGRVKKRKERWVVVDLYSDVVEDREPVVRSKRGRNQTLPYRFRDSVVEPLKRLGRSSSTVNARKRLFQ